MAMVGVVCAKVSERELEKQINLCSMERNPHRVMDRTGGVRSLALLYEHGYGVDTHDKQSLFFLVCAGRMPEIARGQRPRLGRPVMFGRTCVVLYFVRGVTALTRSWPAVDQLAENCYAVRQPS